MCGSTQIVEKLSTGGSNTGTSKLQIPILHQGVQSPAPGLKAAHGQMLTGFSLRMYDRWRVGQHFAILSRPGYVEEV